MSKTQPLEHLSALATARIPLLHVCDRLDPWFEDQTRIVEKRYKEMGGEITVIINDGPGTLAATDQIRAADFIAGKAR
jgi:hypothetical protein